MFSLKPREIMRKIPVTMATQHPDNAKGSPFTGNSFVSTKEEIDECVKCFSELGTEEYMWDWEGKFVDEAVIDRLLQDDFDYFKKNQLGKDKFLTFRIPNIWEEKTGQHRLQRAFMNAISAESAAKNFGLHTPPIFEMILPMTTSSDQLIHLQKTFWETSQAMKKIYKTESSMDEIEFIPLLEEIETMADPTLIEKYVDFLEHKINKKPKYLRIFIARSDPAMNAGLIPTILAVKSLINNYHEFGKSRGISIYPWIGGGSLPFRGGVNPENIDEIIEEYKGTASFSIQSAFRNDYPLEDVKAGIKKLNEEVPKNLDKYTRISNEDLVKIREFNREAAKIFKLTIEPLAPFINEIAKKLPSHRERVQHIGLFGYARGIGEVKLPRAIKFTGAFYSLGIPPEFISTGRVLNLAKKTGMLPIIENLYVNLRKDLLHAGKYFNRENLELLSRENPAFKPIKKDIKAIEDYLGEKLEPKESRHFLHRNFSSNIYYLRKANKDFSRDLLEAARFRKSLG